MQRKSLWAGVMLGLCGTAASAQDFGNAVWFDGVNDQIVSNANFDTSRLTVEAWVYVISLPQGSCGLAAWGRNSDASWEVGLGEGSVAFAINWNKPTEKRFRADEAFRMNEWTHLAVTYDNTYARLYVNGELVRQEEFNMPITPGGTGAYMALNNQFPGINEFGETIFDEVRIWSSARSQEDIRCAMWHEIDTATSGLMAYYKFNEPPPGGQTVPDASLSGRGATLGASAAGGSDDPVRIASSAPYRCVVSSLQPVGALRGPGCDVTMTYQACGVGDLSYQWYLGSDPVPGATSPTLSLTNLTLAQTGNYTCVAASTCGTAMSDPAFLNVCVADVDCTGVIDGDDLVEFFASWDSSSSFSDTDGSGGVDGDDIIMFMTAWENGC